MTLDQYNALLTAAPLLESVLAKENLEVARPNYDSPPSAAAAESGSGSGEDEAEEAASDDEDVVKE